MVHLSPACSEFKMGSKVEDQQVSCLWQGSNILSVSVSGFINYLDVNNPDKPLRVIRVCLSVSVCLSVCYIYTCL